MNRLLLVLVILLAGLGCAKRPSQAAVPSIPEVQQSTTGVTQYDYKAGRPDEVKAPSAARVDSVNPYLIPQYIDMEKYFPKMPDAPSTGITTGGGSYVPFYQPVVFWNGTATVTVQ